MEHWCCLFTCLTTRAVHIEIVRILDTDSCLAAITSFIAKHGMPSNIISDNGTNFIGSTARELKEYIKSCNPDQTTSALAEKHIAWKFNLPGGHISVVYGRDRLDAAKKQWLLYWVIDISQMKVC